MKLISKFPPVTKEKIQEVESKLDFSLSPSYKEFLHEAVRHFGGRSTK